MRTRPRWIVWSAVLSAGLLFFAPSKSSAEDLVISISGVGKEGEILERQLNRFSAMHPDLRIIRHYTPDDSTQRHQLYIQWLNARSRTPDVLQLDNIWVPEFAAAGWIADLSPFRPDVTDIFSQIVRSSSWEGRLYAMPWFVDVGLLYYRSDLIPSAPSTYSELREFTARAPSLASLSHSTLVRQSISIEYYSLDVSARTSSC